MRSREITLVGILISKDRRRRLIDDAATARGLGRRRSVAIAAIIIYNLIGLADIFSTIAAIEGGVGVESNPIMRAAMESLGEGWVLVKLSLQAVISAMVLWFPHWVVIGFFSAAAAGNALIVYNNFVIGGFI